MSKYKLVPVEPTLEMLGAAQRAWMDDPARRSSTLWKAMLAAAPGIDLAQPVGWQPIETAPKGQRILVVTEKRVPFFAKYILPRTHEANSDSALDWAEWDEMSDTPWCPEGWYMEVDCELCEVDYRQYAGMPLTQWMPVPGVPE